MTPPDAFDDWLDSPPNAEADEAARADFHSRTTEPVPPSAADWARVRSRIQHGCRRNRVQRSWLKGSVSVAAAVALVTWLALPPTEPAPRPAEPEDALAAYAVLPMMNADEVVIDSVHGNDDDHLLVGRHPLTGMLALIASDEIRLDGLSPDAGWPTGEPNMAPTPGDAPILFAELAR